MQRGRFLIGLALAVTITAALMWTPQFVSKFDHSYEEDGSFRVGTIAVHKDFELSRRRTAALSRVQDLNEKFQKKEVFLSKWMEAKSPFHAVGISWLEELPEETSVHVEMRTRRSNGRNSEWVHVVPDIDSATGVQDDKSYAFVRTDWSTHVQYRIQMYGDGTNTPRVSDIELTYIDSTVDDQRVVEADPVEEVEEVAELAIENLVAAVSLNPSGMRTGKLNVISRSEWGANESLRIWDKLGKPEQVEPSEEFLEEFGDEIELKKVVKKADSGKLLKWPLEYPEQPIETIFVHHTASTEDIMQDGSAAVRAIYYYHTVTRGWGDIGYNYLIDEYGNVYEGRAGGAEVVGAHTARFNVGSVGVAVIGNYEEEDLQYGSVNSLIKLLAKLVEDFDLDPTGVAVMRGENLNVISGHRDAKHTTCPGQYIYQKLPDIRQLVKAELIARGSYEPDDRTRRIEEITAQNGIDFDDFEDRGIIAIGPEDTKVVTVKLTNTGTKTWNRNTALVLKNVENNIAEFETTVGYQKQARVAPGAMASFDVPIKGTFKSGLRNYYLYVKAGDQMSERNILFPVYIEPARITFEMTELQIAPRSSLKKNESTKAVFTLENTGNVSWLPGAVSVVSKTSETLFSEGRMVDGITVKPGGKATFEAMFNAGLTSGDFNERIGLSLVDRVGGRVISRSSADFRINVKGAPKATSSVSKKKGIYLGEMSKDITFAPGERKRVWVEVENYTGDTWKRIAKDRLRVTFLKSAFIGSTNEFIETPVVQNGGTARISFDVIAPERTGNHFVGIILHHGDKKLNRSPIRFEFKVVDPTEVPVEPAENPTTETNDASPMAVETPSPVSTVGAGHKVRVKLGFNGNPLLTAKGAMQLYDNSGKHLNGGNPIPANEYIEVTYADSQYNVSFLGKNVKTPHPIRIKSADGVMEIDNFSNRPQWNPRLNDNEYRGVLEVRMDDGKLVTINELPLEHYMRGIAEVSNGHPYEKIKTMMVIARSYAYFYSQVDESTGELIHSKFLEKPYHLDDDPNSTQKYLGYGLEKRSPNVVKAVQETEGEVVTYNGEVVKTPYFNSTDGTATRSASEVWGWTDTPYLVSVPDTQCDGKAFNGHGVGLSGCGAAGAALNGYTYDQIIKHYYTGVEITDLY